LPGAGLFLLRASAAIGVVVEGVACLHDWHSQPNIITLMVAVPAMASGALLLIGYLTPLAAVLAMLINVACLFAWIPAPDVFSARSTVALAAVIAGALVCLGPGAFSLDSRLFGRREIIIPAASELPRS
jgi:uncharacterized membrane protein YphA (DoxX/SURF4 family)